MSKLYCVINLTTNERFTDAKGRVRLFDTGKDAATFAAEMSESLGMKCQPRIVQGDKKWQERELARFGNGEYKYLPWSDERWWKANIAKSRPCEHHFAHVSLKDPTHIAFTDTPEKGELDIQTKMTAGRYLQKFYSYWLTANIIADLSATFGFAFETNQLKFATTADEIEHVYTHGPNSCMSYPASKYSSPEHPVRMYAAGDLAVAYIEREERITARCVCWPAKKAFSRVYGDATRLKGLLRVEGYRSNYCSQDGMDHSLHGAKLVRKMYNGLYIVPYVDEGECVDDGKNLVIDLNGEGHINSYVADTATGLSEQHPNDDDGYEYHCDACEGGCNDTWTVNTRNGNEAYWCESCRDNDSFYCAHCQENFASNYHNRVAIRCPHREYWCSSCASRDAFCCPITNDYYYDDEAHIVMTNDGEQAWSKEAVESHAVEINGVYCAKDYVEAKAELFIGRFNIELPAERVAA